MPDTKNPPRCGDTAEDKGGCCKVEAVISIDERGQMILPKGVRKNMGIHAGDKLAVVTWQKEGDLCCISLVRVDWLSDLVKGILGPVMSDVAEP